MSSQNANNFNLLADSTDIQTITQIITATQNLEISDVANLQNSLNTVGSRIVKHTCKSRPNQYRGNNKQYSLSKLYISQAGQAKHSSSRRWCSSY